VLPASAALARYPARPITLVVPNPPGGFVDALLVFCPDLLAKVTSRW
jgi:tripartite-type tricarboxylate transporter receptor subunit TctC